MMCYGACNDVLWGVGVQVFLRLNREGVRGRASVPAVVAGLGPTPYTLHPIPYTLHPTPHTLLRSSQASVR